MLNIGTINQLKRPITVKSKKKMIKVPQALGIFFFSSQVTGALIIVAKTIASKNNNTTVITVRVKRISTTIAIKKVKAFTIADVRLLTLIFSMV